MARCVWALAEEELVEHMCQAQEPAARNWLFTMIDSVPHEQLVTMCVTLWAVWHARRKAIHEDTFQSPLSTHHFVQNFVSDLEQAKERTKSEKPRGAPVGVHPRWIPPPAEVAKLNVDAAVAKTTDMGSVAAVARSATGVFLGASAMSIKGLVDPESLEA
jgi:hypothetical protein